MNLAGALTSLDFTLELLEAEPPQPERLPRAASSRAYEQPSLVCVLV
jgi:hypothetical protein